MRGPLGRLPSPAPIRALKRYSGGKFPFMFDLFKTKLMQRMAIIYGLLSIFMLQAVLAGTQSPAQPLSAPGATASASAETVPPVRIIPDPIEPINRGFHGFNNAFSYFILTPLEHGYTFIMPEPARKSIKKAGYNLLYPNRLVNNLLQFKLQGAGSETGRFLVNTTAGVLGFFDPATRLGLKNYDADFGQTFAHYGVGWGFYFEMPIFGPSSLRDSVAKPLDSFLNPASYVFLDNFFDFNDLSFTLPLLTRIDTMELDPYATDRDLWALERARKINDLDGKLTPPGAAREYDPVPTLNVAFLRPRDPKFPERAREFSVTIPATGHKLPYSVWMQKKPAPVVYIVQGIGVHRLADSALAFAEAAWQRGFSAVTVSNAMNWEFIEAAGTHALPGYSPDDAADFYAALTVIDKDLAHRYPGRITRRALIGVSLGAMHALFISDLRAAGKTTGVQLDRIVAVNPPVNLIDALHKVDEYYRAPLDWPASERQQRMLDTLLKADKLHDAKYQAGVKQPFTEAESKYLIGYMYRLVLRSVIYSSQKKKNLGVLKAPLGTWRRESTYDTLMRYSYEDYLNQFLLPHYLQGPQAARLSRDDFIRRAELHAIEPDLRTNPQLRVFTNSDDFLITPADQEWLKSVLGSRLTVFPDGGHMGNLHLPDVQEKIFATIEDLKR